MFRFSLRPWLKAITTRRTRRAGMARRRPAGQWNSEILESKALLATFYVDVNNPTGGGNGTESSPYVRIQQAVVAAAQAPGDDVIQIAAGTYRENVVIDDASGALSIQGVAGNRGAVVVDGGGLLLNRNAFSVYPRNDVSFLDLSITNAGRDGIQQLGVYDPAILPLSTKLTVTNVAATGNGLSGVAIINAGSLSLTDSDVSHNGVQTNSADNGVFALRAKDVTIDGVSADYNRGNGIYAEDVRTLTVTDTSLTNSTFGNGLNVRLTGSVTATNIQADFSGVGGNVNGVFINEVDTVLLTGVSASSNSFYGLGIFNIHQSAVLSGIVANDNPRSGIRMTATPTVTITDSSFSRNASTQLVSGLEFTSISELNLDGVTSDDNFNDGLRMSQIASVTIENSAFRRNRNEGIAGASLGPVVLRNTTAAGNLPDLQGAPSAGVSLLNPRTVAIIGGDYSENSAQGILLTNSGVSVSVSGVTAANNGLTGLSILNGSNQFVENVVISDSAFTQNGQSGILITDTTNVEILRSRVAGNGTRVGGNFFPGGVAFSNGTLFKVTESVIEDNTTVGTGGGLHATNTNGLPLTIEIRQSTVSENRSGRDAGGIYFANANVLISDSTIDGNQAGVAGVGSGGGMLMTNVIADLVNNTISGNSAANSGGGLLFSGSASTASRMRQNTVVLNSALSGGGLFLASGRLNASDNLIALNAVTTGPGPDLRDAAQSFFSRAGNLIGDATNSNAVFSLSDIVGTTSPIDPVIGPLAHNGGLTRTHALLAGSPAIDGGNLLNSNAIPALVDQRGYQRSPRTDIGAFENQAPVVADDFATTDEDQPVTIEVLGNDAELDGESLLVIDVEDVTHGSVVINADGTVTFSPASNYNGPASFTYVVSDAAGLTSRGRVEVDVRPVNDAPDAVDDIVVIDEDTLAQIGVLSNDTDVDNDLLAVSAIVSGPSHGVVTINADGTITYTPDADYHGPDSFTYSISDGQGGSDTATVSITVNSINDTPVARDDSASTTEDRAITVDVVGNDSDLEGDPLRVTEIVSGPAGGTVSITDDGRLTYSPNVDFSGTDTIVYRISDGNGGTATATLTITVVSRQDQMENLRRKVEQLRESGILSRNDAKTLLGDLKFSKRPDQTISNLNDFQRSVRRLISSGRLSQQIGADLILDADYLKVSVSIFAASGGGNGGGGHGGGNGNGPK